MLHLFYYHNVADFFRHYEYMNACLSRQTVFMSSEIIPKLVDHRYFYDNWIQEDYVGNYTCGLARNAVAVELRANEWDFADTDFLRSLPDYINDPCVTEFMIKQAVLSSIRSHGLAIGTGINKPEERVRSNEHCTAAGTSVQEVRRSGRIRKNNQLLLKEQSDASETKEIGGKGGGKKGEGKKELGEAEDQVRSDKHNTAAGTSIQETRKGGRKRKNSQALLDEQSDVSETKRVKRQGGGSGTGSS